MSIDAQHLDVITTQYLNRSGLGLTPDHRIHDSKGGHVGRLCRSDTYERAYDWEVRIVLAFKNRKDYDSITFSIDKNTKVLTVVESSILGHVPIVRKKHHTRYKRLQLSKRSLVRAMIFIGKAQSWIAGTESKLSQPDEYLFKELSEAFRKVLACRDRCEKYIQEQQKEKNKGHRKCKTS